MAVAVGVAGNLEVYCSHRGRWALLDPGEIDRARGSKPSVRLSLM
jgi:hypothetical protein